MVEDEENFNMNWGESFDKEYPICYMMHDLLYHSNLAIDEILQTDLFWIDIQTQFQFFNKIN